MKTFKDIEPMVLGLFEKRGWVKWIHEGTRRAYTWEEKKVNANLAEAKVVDHCAKCMNMNGCCFPANNSPQPPLHPKCHCWLMPVRYIEFSANCSEEKFKIYTLRFQKKNDKSQLFSGWGYGMMDADYLISEFCSQAKEKYSKGEFVLVSMLNYGQIINIEITLPKKGSSELAKFYSGWMVYPDGEIQLVTSFVGRTE